MYINYIFEPEYSDIKGEPLTWSDFTTQISKIEQDLYNQQLDRKFKKNPLMKDHEIDMQIDRAYSSIQQHFKVNIKDLHLFKKKRASMAHYSRRTVDEQKDLLTKVNRISMPEHFEFKDVFHNIRKELNAYTGPYHRIPT
jgi:glycyl-tRNA synthetase (class II)